MRNTKGNETRDAVRNCVLHNGWFKFFSIVAVGLIIASFIVPPMGVVEPSVLAAVGELFGFAALGTVIKAIDKGVDAQIQHNNTSITVGDIVKTEETIEDDTNEEF